jgi:hypothetical protein
MSVTVHSRRPRRTPWGQALALLCLAAFPSASLAAESELTLRHAVGLALVGNPGLAEIKARAQALAAVPPRPGPCPIRPSTWTS